MKSVKSNKSKKYQSFTRRLIWITSLTVTAGYVSSTIVFPPNTQVSNFEAGLGVKERAGINADRTKFVCRYRPAGVSHAVLSSKFSSKALIINIMLSITTSGMLYSTSPSKKDIMVIGYYNSYVGKLLYSVSNDTAGSKISGVDPINFLMEIKESNPYLFGIGLPRKFNLLDYTKAPADMVVFNHGLVVW